MATEINRVTNLVSTESLAFMRAIDIEFDAVDCKPNCRMYPVFDGVVVTNFIIPRTGPDTGVAGGRIFADSNGNVKGTFKVPANTFNTGVKEFTLTENPDPLTDPINGSMYGYAVADFQSTGIKQIYQTTITLEEIVYVPAPPPQNMVDPLAQSFFTDGFTGGLFVTSVDLYFQAKDAEIPVIVEIREMINGYPGPGLTNRNARVSLPPSQVNTSSDGSIATKFTFPTPLYLEEDKDYCFVVLANTQNYWMFTCVMGERSFETDKIVFDQPYLGSLFKSQNNMTWTAEQYEDIKFKLYRAKFDTNATGEVVMSTSAPPTTIPTEFMSTRSGSNVIRAELTFDHNLELGSKVGFFVEENGVWNGIPTSKLSGVFNVTSILDRRAFEFAVTQNATSTGPIVHGGFVHEIYIDNQGMGYDPDIPPTVTIADPASGVTATAVPVIVNGKITQLRITHNGSGYTEPPLVSIVGSVGSGASATASLSTKALIVTNRAYSMLTPSVPSLNLSGTSIETLYDYTKGNYDGGNITSYTPGTQAKINLNAKNWLTENAWLCSRMNEKAMLSNNNSSKFTIKMNSSRDNLSPVVSLNSAHVMFSGNLINNQNGEDIFSENPSSFIESIDIASGGAGYSVPPIIEFVNQYGCPGTGAAATATVFSGVITDITITDPGVGYLKEPFIVFNGPSMSKATANVTMAPLNSELRAISGTARSRYISKIVRLANASESARLYLEAYSSHQSHIEVYIRTTMKSDSLIHEDQEWVKMICNTEVNKSSKDQEYLEYEFYLDNMEKYDTADIKIVFRSTQPIDVPSVRNYRAIFTA